jgi:hypothetical protein
MRLDGEERRLVEAMYDELKTTGKVDKTLTADDARIRDLYQAEVVAKRPVALPENVFPFSPRKAGAPPPAVPPKRTRPVKAEGLVVPMEPPRPAPERLAAPATRIRADILKQLQDEAVALAEETARSETAAAPPTTAPEAPPAIVSSAPETVTASPPQTIAGSAAPAAPEPTPPPAAVAAIEIETKPDIEAEPPKRTGRDTGQPRVHLAAEDAIVDAPSIGPKTAQRFNEVGIDTVDEFLQAHPIALAARLELPHVTGDTVTDWQDQARLVMSVPGLRGTHAQLLVGAGYRSDEVLRMAEPDRLCADVLAFATSAAGQRILRDGPPPDVEKIKSWLDAARAVRAA